VRVTSIESVGVVSMGKVWGVFSIESVGVASMGEVWGYLVLSVGVTSIENAWEKSGSNEYGKSVGVTSMKDVRERYGSN
jgi:hypothetical protein